MPKRLVGVLAVLGLAVGAAVVATAVAPATASPSASTAPGGSFVPLTPVSVYDTRSTGRLAPNTDGGVKVAGVGVGGVPADGASAVTVDVTVVDPATGGWLAVFDPATGRNGTSTLNFAAHQRLTTMTVVGLDSAGFIGLRITSQADIVVTVNGYFTTAAAASSTAGLYNPLPPARLMDTRSKLGGTAPGPNGTTTLQVAGRGGVPSSGVSAVVVNVTITGPTAAGFVVAFPAGGQPLGSTVDFARGETRSNRAVVALGLGGKISFHNSAGTTHLVVDVTGYFTDSTSAAGGSYFVPRPAARLVDSRIAGQPTWSTPGTTRSLPMTTDHGSVDAAPSLRSVTPSTAIVVTITSVNPTTRGYLTVYPGGSARPTVSDLNVAPATVTNNLAVAGVGPDGSANVYSLPAGNIVIDTSGYFVRAPATPTPSGMWATWDLGAGPAPRTAAPAVRTNDIHGVSSIIELRTGPSYAVRPDGTVVAWTPPELPSQPGHPLDSSASVHTVDGLTNVKALGTAGLATSTGYALRNDGTLLSWGDNFHGELGRPGPAGLPAAVDITHVGQIGGAMEIGYAIKSDGSVWAWGRNDTGQLGDGTTVDRSEPVQVAGLTDIVSVSGDGQVSYAIDGSGRLWQWGTPRGATAPIPPREITTSCRVGNSLQATDPGTFEQCLNGEVWQLDTDGPSHAPRQVTDLSGIEAIAFGPGTVPSVLAKKNDNTVWRYNDDTGHYQQVYGLANIAAIGGGVGAYYAVTG